MSDKTIAIIGAGIAGLSAGCYAQMNGYRTQLFEMHTIPGGLCTAWKRKGYTFDGCLHHLAGSSPQSGLYRIWEELGAVQGRQMIFRDHFVRVEDPSGKSFTVHTDIDHLEDHLRELALGDGPLLDEYFRALRSFTRLELLALPAAKPLEMVKLFPLIPALIKWGKVSMAQFGLRFSDPFLRRAFPVVQYDFPEVPMLVHLNFIASCHNRTMGWPTGGSRAFAQSIADRYTALGGELHYRSRVTKIIVEGDRAVGVRLADGTEHRADTIISAADGHTTIFGMLEGGYLDDAIRAFYASPEDRQAMNFHVSLGVSRDMSEEPHALTYFLEKPITMLGRERDRLDVEIFNFDPTMAPPGKTVVKVLLDSSYSRWRELYDDRERYNDEKQRVADEVISQLEKRFPGIQQDAEVIDVATPVTVERFTGNWHGLQAWFPKGAGMMTILSGWLRELPGLQNLYLTGQWAGGIGISTGALGGRKLIQAICKRDKRRFEASVP